MSHDVPVSGPPNDQRCGRGLVWLHAVTVMDLPPCCGAGADRVALSVLSGTTLTPHDESIWWSLFSRSCCS